MIQAISPGWYYAQGDPPGTHRYWDGNAWVGMPQPIAGSAAGGMYGGQAAGGTNLAGWGSRLAALLIDTFIVGAIMGVIFGLFFLLVGTADPTSQSGEEAALVMFLVIAGIYLLAIIAYFGAYQGKTGFTFGKKVMNIRLVDMTSGQPPGIGRGIGRYLISYVLGSLCAIYSLLDYAWPLWDDRNQRLTDKIVSTVVARTN